MLYELILINEIEQRAKIIFLSAEIKWAINEFIFKIEKVFLEY